MKMIINQNISAVLAIGFGLSLSFSAGAAAQEIACQAPKPVCSARAAVFVISSFDPFASAVRIGPDLLVTNRHVTADQSDVTITAKNGDRIPGRVIATGYEGDLVLIRVENLGEGPLLRSGAADETLALYTIGADLSRRKIRVYPPGKVLLKPSPTAPFARLQHTALSQAGNSGGALVDEKGRLVGIVASGGVGRYDAFPVGAIEKLKALSGDQFTEKSKAIGAAARACIDFLDNLPPQGKMSKPMAQNLSDTCAISNNRQLMDDAAVALGRARHLELSRNLLEKALVRDPLAINTRFSLIVALTFSGLYSDAIPHIRRLLPVIPKDANLLRYAIQASKNADDKSLGEDALALVKKHDPARAEAAARFLAAPLRKHEKSKAH